MESIFIQTGCRTKMLTNCTLKNTDEKHHPHFQMQEKLGMGVHAADPSIYEWEAGDLSSKPVWATLFQRKRLQATSK